LSESARLGAKLGLESKDLAEKRFGGRREWLGLPSDWRRSVVFELRRICGLPTRDGGNSLGVAMEWKEWSRDVEFARDAQNVLSPEEGTIGARNRREC